MSVKGLIMVRSGSTRVENKNIRPFAGTTLLEIKIKQLLKIKELDGVVVNSNDDKMLLMAEKLGAEAVKREGYYASNTVSINEVYQNIAENCNSEYIVHCNATNPLIKDETISKIINTYFDCKGKYKSVNSATMVKEFMWLGGKPINYDVAKMPRSQDLPDVMALNFAANMISRKDMIECRNVISKMPLLLPIDDIESIDIDYEIDFMMAEFFYKKYNSIS
jgi:N-acylneuraminate cytidylyltransferase